MAVTDDGIIQWLSYVVIGLCSTIFTLWNVHITSRFKGVEVDTGANTAAIRAIETGLERRFASHELEERDRDERHAGEVAREFKELRKEVVDGHAAILKKVNEVARSVNGRT